MNNHVFRDIQELENTILSNIRKYAGKEVKPFSMAAYLEHYGVCWNRLMCVRRNPRTTSSPEVVVFVEHFGVHRINYRPDSIFVEKLTSELKRLGVTLETCSEEEWKKILSEAEKIAR